jgi:monovalent cation:H+ antiporter-2, CPA2 family
VTFAAALGGDTASYFIEIGAVLLVLAILARLASRSGFSPIPFYLIAGLGIGVVAPPPISDDATSFLSQAAIILLLFLLGAEYTAAEVVGSLRSGWRGGAIDLVLNFPPGLAAGLLLGLGWVPATLLGGVTYISSSGIIAKLLGDLDRLGNRETPGILSVLVFEDLAMALYLPLATGLLIEGVSAAVIWPVAVAVAVVAIAFFVAVRHGTALSRGIGHSSDEVVLLTVVGLLLVAGGLAEGLGVSAGVVAFLLGLSLSGPIAGHAQRLLTPLRDLLAAVFFVLFGLQIDVGDIPSVAVAAVVLLLLTAAAKMLTGWLATRSTCSVRGRLRAGTALIARGEFSIVIAGLAVAAGDESLLGPLAATYVLLTAVAGPLLTRYADSLAPLVDRGARRRDSGEPSGPRTRGDETRRRAR